MSDSYFLLSVTSQNPELIKHILQDFEDLVIEEEINEINTLKIYCQENLQEVNEVLQDVFNQQGISFTSTLEEKTNTDWIEKYKKSIKPVEIKNVYIHASWQQAKDYTHNKEGINIEIDPSFAFGTGHHFTTHSMIESILRFVKRDDKVLEIGSGSGVLSILSAKLGAKIDCCDVDKLAYKNTQENFDINNVKYDKCWLGTINQANNKYDCVLGNLTSDVLISLSKQMSQVVNQNGLLILSGILNKYAQNVLEKFKDFDIIHKLDDVDWTTFVLKKK